MNKYDEAFAKLSPEARAAVVAQMGLPVKKKAVKKTATKKAKTSKK